MIDAISGNISTIAGTGGSSGYSGDGGLATSAKLYNPRGLTLDSSRNVYIADTFNHCIRKVSASDGKISTIAGTGGSSGYSGDGGPATSAKFNQPFKLAFDSYGNLYIADEYNHVIRMIDVNGDISTIAGIGDWGLSGDGGPATSAKMDKPRGVAVDSYDNIYIADSGNDRIRKLTPIYEKI